MSCGETEISDDATLKEGFSMGDPLPEEGSAMEDPLAEECSSMGDPLPEEGSAMEDPLPEEGFSMGESLPEEHTDTTGEDKKTNQKVCGICGDVAKCYHFGGLCCDSCKSFFRRSIQSESWETFLCVKGGGCDIRQNRKACQACRFELCKENGMDPSLVMNAEERKVLLLRKLEKRKQLLLMNRRLMDQQQKSNDQENEKTEQQESRMDCDEIREIDMEDATETYCHSEGNNDNWHFTETLSQKNHEKIKGLQKILRKALTFPEFPKHYYEGGTDVTEHLFFVFCKGLGKYFMFVPEFQDLDKKDQSVLLKDAVAKSIFIYGAHQFQEDLECWPRRLLSPYCTFPTITLDATENFIGDDDTFFMLKTFMRKFCRIFDDEIVTLLSLMISVFDTDIPFLIDASKITEYKESYTQLLINYLREQNANFSVSLFMSELSDCLSEVKELKESFQRDRSKEEDVKPLRADEKTSFASSLHDLGEYPKMAPKKAFFERIKVNKSYPNSDIVPRDGKCTDHEKIRASSLNTVESDDEIMMISGIPADPSFIVTQDHNYQKLNTSYPNESLEIGKKFQPPEEEVQILGACGWGDKTCPEDREYVSSSSSYLQKPKGARSNRMALPQILNNFEKQNDLWITNETRYQTYSYRQPSQAFIIPVTKTSSSFSNNTGMGVHQNQNSYSEEIEVDSPVYCSRQFGFDTLHQTNVHDASFYMPMSSQPSLPVGIGSRFMHEARDQEYITSENMPDFHKRAVPTLALKAVPIHLPVNNPIDISGQARAHQYSYSRHENTAPEMHMTPSYSQAAGQPSRALSNKVLQIAQPNCHMSRQSPLSNVCHNLSQLSTQDDKQLVEVAQSVLPPHLMKHLITRLGTGQREQL